MINNILNEAINLIDDDLISNAHSNNSSKKSLSIYKYMAVAAAFAIVLTAVILGVKGTSRPIIESTTNPSIQFGGNNSSNSISDGEIVFENSAYTDEEIRVFIEENKDIIAGNTALEYQIFDKPIKIATKGYSPVYLGETNKIILDNLTLPIMIDDKIVGSVSLFKVDGEIKYTTSAHGDTWDRLTNALKENPDSELAFFCVGLNKEIAITPDNKVYQLLSPVTLPLDKNVDYYNKFKTEYNVYSWKILNDENNYVVVDVAKLDLDTNVETSKNDTTSTTKTNDNLKEPTTNNSNVVTITNSSEKIIDLKLEDVLNKEISSIEINSGTRLLLGQKPITASEEQKEKVLTYISSISYTEAVDYQKGFGGNYSVKLNYHNGSSVEIVFMDKYFYIYSPDGHSTVYADKTENTKNLIYYIVEQIL